MVRCQRTDKLWFTTYQLNPDAGVEDWDEIRERATWIRLLDCLDEEWGEWNELYYVQLEDELESCAYVVNAEPNHPHWGRGGRGMSTITIKHYDYDLKEEIADADVGVHSLARSMDAEQFAQLLEDWVNNFSSRYKRGLKIGHELRRSHRTLQRSVIVELVGIIAGLSEQEYTDLRNEHAIHLAKQIKRVYEEIGAGGMV